ncbi:MAG: 50S ribosomal protein L9 [Deltaproteobacteria bacterium RIFOXYA12_FULL_58_15]|nr:MAG: 50S ribosomal protein L9 [Deltaproteobacteria bacterium RIFOXYA12_FULL_58_15]OGR09671.1 MAG: 50S ribosomal protein L9 [Deltaproteobacteria bacterium RIFOXYB12_FULL_58_9]
MEIILIEDVANLGVIGDLVTVKDGYARNLLLPHKMAIPASTKSKKRLEHEKRLASFSLARAKKDAEAQAARLANVSVTIARKVGEQDKLFGSVTTHDIARGLADEGVELDRRQILLDEPIKALGVYQVPVRLNGAVNAQVKVWVVAE